MVTGGIVLIPPARLVHVAPEFFRESLHGFRWTRGTRFASPLPFRGRSPTAPSRTAMVIGATERNLLMIISSSSSRFREPIDSDAKLVAVPRLIVPEGPVAFLAIQRISAIGIGPVGPGAIARHGRRSAGKQDGDEESGIEELGHGHLFRLMREPFSAAPLLRRQARLVATALPHVSGAR
jgi:hypothetical protein